MLGDNVGMLMEIFLEIGRLITREVSECQNNKCPSIVVACQALSSTKYLVREMFLESDRRILSQLEKCQSVRITSVLV